MKCFYYLSPTLVSTHQISDDLHDTGVNDWFLHVVSKDESGLNKEHLHSSNYLETLDVIREGLIGAAFGFLAGIVAAGMIKVFEPFGPETPLIAYFIILFVFTCFGAWVGGLDGIAHENKKLLRFHDDIEAGKYLILIYANKNLEVEVQSMMAKQHPEAQLVGFDSKFYNPFNNLSLVE